MKFSNLESTARPRQTFGQLRIPNTLTVKGLQLGLVVLSGLGIGLAVIVATYYADNVKLLVGLVGGLGFLLLTMRWPEFGILCYVALLSGLVSLGSLPALRLGPISIHISDIILMLILGLVFLRTTAHQGFTLYGSPLMLPLLLFIGAFLLSAVNAVIIQGVSPNTILRSLRTLVLWMMFIPTLQLVRNEKALRRLLIGLLILTGILLIGVLFPNRFSPLLNIEEVSIGTDFTRIYYAGDMILYAMILVTVASLAMIKRGNHFWRIGLLSLLIYWVFRTYFRQYWLTLFVTCLLLLVFLSSQERMRLLKRMAPAIIAGVLLVIVLMAAQPAQVERIAYLVTDRVSSLGQNPLKEASLGWRMIETRYALIKIGRHPIFGIGLANSYRPPMIAESGGSSYAWTYRYIENGYLYIALFMGLVGLLPFLWLCVAYLFRVLKHQHEILDDGLRAIYLGFGLSFLGMMACNIATPTFVIGSRLVFFPVTMAISEVILRLECEKSSHS